MKKKYALTNDQSLLDELRSGNHQAFTQLYVIYYPQLCHLSCLYLQDDECSKDLVQQVFMRLWETHASLNISSSIRNYLYTLVKNASLNQLRHTEDSPVRCTDPALLQDDLADPGLHELLEKEHKYRCFRQALERLPRQKREVFLLKLHGLGNREIAARLGVSESSVKNYYTLSVRLLRRYFQAIRRQQA